MIDSPYLVRPGKKFRIKERETKEKGDFSDREVAEAATTVNLERLAKLQEVFYADSRHALLIVLQAMDAGGKDGAIRSVFRGVNPQGCMVTSFKAPSSLELAHDFLWRIHAACPPKGMIGIFNRSHYESVLVERVKKLVPERVWRPRYGHIRHFEKMLADEGTTILKFYLHISKDEQRERLQARLDEPEKNWKFNPGDLVERKRWSAYMSAFEEALAETSTEVAPWYVVPSDRKWFRNWVLSDVIVRTVESLKLRFPPPVEGLEKIVIE